MIRKVTTTNRQAWMFIVVLCAATVVAAPARGAFHLWQLKEIYTDSTGTLQFIELFTTFGNQQFVNGQTIQVTDITNTFDNFFTHVGDLPGNSANKHFLIGTAGIQAAGAPAPDYIMPDNFLFLNGGTINFYGVNSGPYTALPTGGVLSRNWTGGDFINTPTNFAGAVGQVVVPEPATMVLTPLALGVAGLFRWRSRRRNARVVDCVT